MAQAAVRFSRTSSKTQRCEPSPGQSQGRVALRGTTYLIHSSVRVFNSNLVPLRFTKLLRRDLNLEKVPP